MSGVQLSLIDDVSARRAEIAGRPRSGAEAPEQLDLERDGEVLILQHRSRVRAVQHQAVVAHRPGRPARHLIAGEIQIGGIGALAPNKRDDLARLGFRAMLAGTMANLMSASIVGIML